jgi:hypothetical protein
MSVTVSLKTTGIDQYKANLDKITIVVGTMAAQVEGNAKDSILTSSGKYKERVSGLNKDIKTYSSPPGTPPNTDTGNLANSIGHRMIGKTKAEITAGKRGANATADAKYAVALELGWTAKGGNTVPARPFMEPALMKVKPAFIKALSLVLKGK